LICLNCFHLEKSTKALHFISLVPNYSPSCRFLFLCWWIHLGNWWHAGSEILFLLIWPRKILQVSISATFYTMYFLLQKLYVLRKKNWENVLDFDYRNFFTPDMFHYIREVNNEVYKCLQLPEAYIPGTYQIGEHRTSQVNERFMNNKSILKKGHINDTYFFRHLSKKLSL